MPFARRSRALSALLGLWFLVAGQEPPFPHPCEMGMGADAEASTRASDHAGHLASQGEEEHGAHAEHTAESHGEDPGGEPAPDTCECVGDCCCTPAIDCVAVATALPTAGADEFASPSPALDRKTSAARQHRLPWANGPPVALS